MDVVAVRHVSFEDLGSWGPRLIERGATITYVEAGIDGWGALKDADLVVILGGPVSAYDTHYPWLDDEVSAVRARLDRDAPTLGVCLGAQLIAAALGAPVYQGRREIGWGEVDLTPDGADSPLAAIAGAPVLHWHGDTFDLPEGATLLASTSATPHQAFAVGRSLALQFHAEVDGTAIERWLVGHAHELDANGIDVAALRAESGRIAADAARAGGAVLDAYLAAAVGG